MSRDEARLLARQFAVQLRHLREFRGQAYVGAAPSPRRTPEAVADEARTWPTGQVAAPADGAAPIPAPKTWPSGQVDDNARPIDTIPPHAETDIRRSAAGSPTVTRDPSSPARPVSAPADPALTTWPSGQVPQDLARADRTDPVRPAAAPTAERAPVHLPTLPAEDPPAAEAGVRDKARTWTAAEKLDYLRRKNIGNCQRCKLAGARTQIVFGVGDPEADVMFIGEAPGFDEDRQGEPFVGAAGRRLTQWLGRLGLGREQVYIANVLKCRPPGNRDPEVDEVERCSPFLRAQIRAIAPKVIVALGRHAGMLLLGGHQERTLREMRGRAWDYKDPTGAHQAALFVTYHPSYVIRRERELSPGQRNPADDTVMADLQQALRSIEQA